MAKNVEKNGNGLGEISTIRDILMGQQMNEYETRFQEMQHLLQAAENRMIQQMQVMQSEADNRIGHLENTLKKTTKELKSKIELTADRDRIRLGKLLADLSNELLNGGK